jgi:ABC-type phosphate/phosphonate transport system substrate-binding protein
VLDGFGESVGRRFVDALLGMDYNNPSHRPILDLEGLKRWVPATTEGYKTLFAAVEEQGIT